MAQDPFNISSLADYDSVTKAGAAYTQGLMRIWERLGRPDDCSTEMGWTMMDQLVNCWTVNFPKEANDWLHDRQFDLETEITLSELSKKDGGYNPISYPPTLFQLIRAMLPHQKLNDKKFLHKLSQRHPLFKTTNLKI